MLHKYFQLLGIEPTDDLGLVKKAYAQALKKIDRRKNIEGFQALRNAFRALEQHLANSSAEPENAPEGIENEFNTLDFKQPKNRRNELDEELQQQRTITLNVERDITEDDEPQNHRQITPPPQPSSTNQYRHLEVEKSLSNQQRFNQVIDLVEKQYLDPQRRFHEPSWRDVFSQMHEAMRPWDDDDRLQFAHQLTQFLQLRPFLPKRVLQTIHGFYLQQTQAEDWETFLDDIFTDPFNELAQFYIANHYYEDFWQLPDDEYLSLYLPSTTTRPLELEAVICVLMELQLMEKSLEPPREDFVEWLQKSKSYQLLLSQPLLLLQFALASGCANPQSPVIDWLSESADTRLQSASEWLQQLRATTLIEPHCEMNGLANVPAAIFTATYRAIVLQPEQPWRFHDYYMAQSRASHGKIKSRWYSHFSSWQNFIQQHLEKIGPQLTREDEGEGEGECEHETASPVASPELDPLTTAQTSVVEQLAAGNTDIVAEMLFTVDDSLRAVFIQWLNDLLPRFVLNYRQQSNICYSLLRNTDANTLIELIPNYLEDLAFTALHTDVLLAHDLLDHLEAQCEDEQKKQVLQSKRYFYGNNYLVLTERAPESDDHWEVVFYHALAHFFSGNQQPLLDAFERYPLESLTPSPCNLDVLQGTMNGAIMFIPKARGFAKHLQKLIGD